MSAFSDLLRRLHLLGPEQATVVDTIFQPVADVDIHILTLAGTVLDTTRTDTNGNFAFAAGISCPAAFELLVDPAELAARFRFHDPIGALTILTVRRPLTLTDSVGIEGTNARLDLRRLQDHLQHLGRLTDADIGAEPIDIGAPGAMDAADLPLLMKALYAQLRAGCAETPRRIELGSHALSILNAVQPVAPLIAGAHVLATSVGEAPGRGAVALALNAPGDFRFVQDRLLQLGFLTRADYAAEQVDPAAAVNPVPTTVLPRTIAAIRAFNDKVVGSSQHAIFSGAAQEELLRDPYSWGQLPLRLQDAVGAAAVNRPRDVRALQERLHDLELLADADYTAERVALVRGAPELPVATAALARTVAAIQRVHTDLLGAVAPVPKTIEPDDPALAVLNRVPTVDIFMVGDEQPPISRLARTDLMNHPAHVRAVQERLHLLGYLTDVAFLIELANPAALASVPSLGLASTLAAIRAVQRDMGITTPGLLPVAGGERLLPAHRPAPILLHEAVGAGEINQPRDVRAVQDRLRMLRFLPEADYQRERVDPAAAVVDPAGLVSTFAATSSVRQRVFGLPAAGADPWTAQPVIRPDSDTLGLLNDPLFFGRAPLQITASVGELGANRVGDVRAIQARLNLFGLLSNAELATESPIDRRRDRVRDDELPRTIAGIRTLRRVFLSENPVVGRIESAHPALIALSRPFERLRLPMSLIGSVGTAGNSTVADVHAVQRRLRDLRVLGADAYDTESALVADPVDFRQLPVTQAAIDAWRTANDGADAANPPIGLFDAARRRLEWPALPIATALGLTNSVGAPPAANRSADVILVQDRLHELGLLTTPNYLRERRIAAGLAVVGAPRIADTIDSIRLFQNTASGGLGGADGIISATGHTARVLRDPTYATPVSTNPDTRNRSAGPAMPAHWDASAVLNTEVIAMIDAIELWEAGGSNGEVPAILRNGSKTPASFGKAQVIGATAVATLDGDPPTRDFYGLEAGDLAALSGLITRVGARYDAIYAAVAALPAPVSEANLLIEIHGYQAANTAAFLADTGLGPSDIENMFRTAQLRRQMQDFINAQAGANVAAKRAAAVAAAAGFVARPDVGTNLAAIEMTQRDAESFLRSLIDNEHRAGFIMRALFYSEHGLAMKHAMTDDSGFKLGRFVINDNFHAVLAAEAAAVVALTDNDRALVTARIHNSGRAGLAGFVANPASAANAYTNNVIAGWVDPTP